MVPEAFHCSLMNRAGRVVLIQPLLSPWASNTGTLMNDPLWQPSPAAGHARHGPAARPHRSSHCYLFPTFILVNQCMLYAAVSRLLYCIIIHQQPRGMGIVPKLRAVHLATSSILRLMGK